MYRVIGVWLALCAIAGCAHAQPPAASQPATSQPAKAQALSADSPVDQVLDALDARGKDLADFTAIVTKADTDTSVGNETRLSGQMWMQRLDQDDSRLRVLFDRKEVNDNPPKSERHEFMLSQGMLIERKYVDSTEVRRQVLKPGQKMNLLKLGEGPFPLPLGQDKADVHRMFEVAKIPPAADDPPQTIHVQLKPKPGTQFEPKFRTIDFWVEPTSRMPVKIVTEDPNQTTTITTELKDIKVNSNLTDKDFDLPPIDEKKWAIRQEAFAEE